MVRQSGTGENPVVEEIVLVKYPHHSVACPRYGCHMVVVAQVVCHPVVHDQHHRRHLHHHHIAHCQGYSRELIDLQLGPRHPERNKQVFLHIIKANYFIGTYDNLW